MRQVQNGQFDRFEQLVERYRAPLLRVAESKLGNRAWAEDVVQEAFLAIFAARHTYDPRFAFRTWLWTVLLNLCRKQWTRKKKRPQEVHRSALDREGCEAFSEPRSYETGLEKVLLIEQREQLLTLLSDLPEVQADALRLRFYGGLKYAEIAETMGCSLGGAKLRVRSGLKALAERLGDSEGDSP
jgi:RNA polymerase sigma-70 factor (ECF subfamily)